MDARLTSRTTAAADDGRTLTLVRLRAGQGYAWQDEQGTLLKPTAATRTVLYGLQEWRA